jgi:hypothetical protein
MRIFGLTVGRNEAGRYLETMLWHMHGIVDNHFFFDDRSDDETVSIAEEYCVVTVRPDAAASFSENEGAFRGQAWKSFEHAMRPVVGDWVLVIDCDEVLVGNHQFVGDPNSHRSCLVSAILRSGRVAIDLAIPEVWGFYDEDDGRPLTRHDGFWGTIHAPRLFAYMPGGSYFQGPYGVPAIPNYAQRGPWDSTDEVSLMHYGYADERDWQEKYERYTGQHGHSNVHVESILDRTHPMDLRTWEKPYVKEMRRRARKR